MNTILSIIKTFRNLKLKLLIIFIACSSIQLKAQEKMTKINLSQQQQDPRIYVEIEHSRTAYGGFQFVNIHITNNTSDILRVRLEFSVTSTSEVKQSMRIGGWGNSGGYLDIKPGQRIDGDQNNCQMQFYGECKGKEIKLDDGISCINYISYQIIDIKNLSEEERKIEIEKKEKEKANQLKKEQEEAVKKQQDDKAEKERLAQQKKDEETKKKDEETKKNEENTKNEQEKTQTKAVENNSTVNSKENEEDKKIAEKQRLEQEEEQNRQKKINDYNNWKEEANIKNDQQDLANSKATIGLLGVYWNLLYGDMGKKIETRALYISPPYKDRFKPGSFINYKYGLSGTYAPTLYKSTISTLNYYGNRINLDSMISTDNVYINFGGEFDFGILNDFYSFYVSPQILIGTTPTWKGYNLKMSGVIGGELGVKNFKIYSKYKFYMSDYRSLRSSDIEEIGEGAVYDITPFDIEYGIKYTFGGEQKDNFIRQHLYFGAINKNYNLKGIDDYVYDPQLKKYSNTGSYSMQGFHFEWKKDHNFSFYSNIFPSHLYFGTLKGTWDTKTFNKVNDNGTYIEIGFLRAFDVFKAHESKIKTVKPEKTIKREITAEDELHNKLDYVSFGIVSGSIAHLGFLFEISGTDSRFGLRTMYRSSFTPTDKILDGSVVENKTIEISIGCSYRITNRFHLYTDLGFGEYENYDLYQGEKHLNSHMFLENGIGTIFRLNRIININAGFSFINIYDDFYTPELTCGLSFNLQGERK